MILDTGIRSWYRMMRRASRPEGATAMADLVDVVVKVPSDRVADLYAMVAQLNRPQTDAGPSPKPGAGARPRDETSGDVQDLVRMLRVLAQDFFRYAA